jgi:hypothetical protein
MKALITSALMEPLSVFNFTVQWVIILSTVLYNLNICFSLREEQKLKIFENKVWRKYPHACKSNK